MSHDRTHHIRTLTAIFLECRSVMASAGITASTAEVIDLRVARRAARSGGPENGFYDPRARADPRALAGRANRKLTTQT